MCGVYIYSLLQTLILTEQIRSSFPYSMFHVHIQMKGMMGSELPLPVTESANVN